VWNLLSSSDELAWDNISDKGKMVFMFEIKPTDPRYDRPNPTKQMNKINVNWMITEDDEFVKRRLKLEMTK